MKNVFFLLQGVLLFIFFSFFTAYFFTRAGAGAGQKKTGAGQKWTGSATLLQESRKDFNNRIKVH